MPTRVFISVVDISDSCRSTTARTGEFGVCDNANENFDADYYDHRLLIKAMCSYMRIRYLSIAGSPMRTVSPFPDCKREDWASDTSKVKEYSKCGDTLLLIGLLAANFLPSLSSFVMSSFATCGLPACLARAFAHLFQPSALAQTSFLPLHTPLCTCCFHTPDAIFISALDSCPSTLLSSHRHHDR